MQINNSVSDKYYTPYKTNTSVKAISGFALNTDGKVEVQEADKNWQGFAKFVDYQEFHKAWMSQGATTEFSYTDNQGFHAEENSISLVPGMMVRLANGFTLSINKFMVQASGDFRNNEAAKESTSIAFLTGIRRRINTVSGLKMKTGSKFPPMTIISELV